MLAHSSSQAAPLTSTNSVHPFDSPVSGVTVLRSTNISGLGRLAVRSIAVTGWKKWLQIFLDVMLPTEVVQHFQNVFGESPPIDFTGDAVIIDLADFIKSTYSAVSLIKAIVIAVS